MGAFREKAKAQGVAVGSVLGVLLVDLALRAMLGQGAPVIALLLAVIVAAMYGGIAAGIGATVFGAVIAGSFLIPVPSGLAVPQAEWIRLGLFLAEGVLVSWLVGSRARALAEAHKAVDDLRERDERYQLVLAGSEAAIRDWDVLNKRVELSPRWKQLRGLTDAEVSNSEEEWVKRIHPDDLGRVMNAVELHFNGETPVFSAEYRVCHKDGHWIWITDHGVAQRDSDGRVTRMAGSERDITERKEAEQALQASEQRLRRAIEEAPFPVIVHAEDGAILQVSRALTEITGYSKDDLRTVAQWTERAYGERKTWAQAEIDRLYQLDESVDEGEYWIRTAQGDERIWEFASSPLGLDDSNRRLVISMAADVTERKRAEETVREADRRKDEFLAVLAHELRNPLAPLRSGLELLALHAMPDEIGKVRTMMERQVSHLTRLVDDLLDLSRINRGNIKLQRNILDLNEVIKSAIELATPGITQRRHELKVDCAATSLLVNGDAQRLVQVVSNVLSNAARYTEPGGTIWLRSEVDQSWAVVEIKDTGFGIPPEQLEDVFEMFTQVQEHRSATGGGELGIGLAISRQLVHLHGGSIEAKSDGIGQGSKFVLRLPLEDQVKAAEKPQEEAVVNCRRRVLIVDDNRDAGESMSALLQLRGHTLRIEHDGIEAINAVKAFAPDVVILDIGMPEMDGYEVARRIRALPSGKEVLLIALTGWGQESDKARARAAGFDEHLTKPIDGAFISALIATPGSSTVRPVPSTGFCSPAD